MYCRIHTHLNTIFHEQVWREYVFKKLREGFSLKRSHMLVIEVCLLEVSVSVWLLIYIVMTCSCSTPWGFVVLCGVSHFHNRSSSGHHQRGVVPRGTWCISICRDLGSPNKTGGTLCTWVSRSLTLSPEEENRLNPRVHTFGQLWQFAAYDRCKINEWFEHKQKHLLNKKNKRSVTSDAS